MWSWFGPLMVMQYVMYRYFGFVDDVMFSIMGYKVRG